MILFTVAEQNGSAAFEGGGGILERRPGHSTRTQLFKFFCKIIFYISSQATGIHLTWVLLFRNFDNADFSHEAKIFLPAGVGTETGVHPIGKEMFSALFAGFFDRLFTAGANPHFKLSVTALNHCGIGMRALFDMVFRT